MSEHQPPADPYQPHEPSGFEPPVPPVPAPYFPAQGSPTGPHGESPTYPMPAAGQPYPSTAPVAAPGQPGYPTSGIPLQPGFPTMGQPGFPPPPDFPPPGYPAPAAQPTPRKRRGLMITLIVLGVVVLLCAGGGVTGFLLTRNLDGKGQTTPVAAVTGFLGAVYDQKDATKAGTYVCGAARDSKAITRKINEARKAQQKYESAQFRWSTPVVAQQKVDSAIVTTKLRLLTTDERVAEQDLKFTVVKKNGWLVCEVQQQKS